jgi:hypothetical protein
MVFQNPASLSYFPNGVAQMTYPLVGGAAGDHTVPNIETGDMILAVQAVELGAGPSVADVHYIGGEFTITGDDTINNDGGTDTTNMLLLVTIAAGRKRYSM